MIKNEFRDTQAHRNQRGNSTCRARLGILMGSTVFEGKNFSKSKDQ
jgi:hypothetical protein